ncbi:MAG: hypothetical protein M0Z67_09690 [Nitrospiraceae bacterium]|nr:hypothetical protein [Nitrospiraceae bacterium]
MLLDVIIDKDSLPIEIPNPYHPDLETIVGSIGRFAASKGADLSGLDVRGLIPAMIRGVAGCEKGCPANAKDLASKGFQCFDLEYVEGGILTATASAGGDRLFYLKMFPDF